MPIVTKEEKQQEEEKHEILFLNYLELGIDIGINSKDSTV